MLSVCPRPERPRPQPAPAAVAAGTLALAPPAPRLHKRLKSTLEKQRPLVVELRVCLGHDWHHLEKW